MTTGSRSSPYQARSTSPSILVQGVALSLLAALLAGLYPAWRMATASPADSLRDE